MVEDRAVEVEYTEDGDPQNPPVLLLGPLGLTWDVWDEQVAVLATKFRVIRYHHRGIGATPRNGLDSDDLSVVDFAGDALALLDKLGIEKAHFVGMSLGALTALWIAAEHPERVDRMVTMSAVPRADQDTATMLQIISNALHAYERYYEYGVPLGWNEYAEIALSEGIDAAVTAMMKMLVTDAATAQWPEKVGDIRTQLTDLGPELFAALCRVAGRMNLTPLLRHITAPLAILACEDDWSTPPGTSRQLTLAIPSSIRLIIPKAAHLTTLPDPWGPAGLTLAHLTDRLAATANLS